MAYRIGTPPRILHLRGARIKPPMSVDLKEEIVRKIRFAVPAIAALTLIAAAACSSSSGSGSGTTSSTQGTAAGSGSTSSAPASSSGELNIASYGSTIEANQLKVLIEPFEKKYNVKVNLVEGASAEFLTKMVASAGGTPPFDVVQFSSGEEETAYQKGLLVPLDPKIVTNMGSLADGMVQNNSSVAFALTAPSIMYNTDKVSPAPTSWSILGDPKYKGQVAIPDVTNSKGVLMLVKFAEMNGGSVQNIQPGIDAIAKIAPNAAVVFSQTPTMLQLIQQGVVNIAVWDQGYAYSLKQKGLPIASVIPQEGSILQQFTMGVVKGTKNSQLAQEFVNMALSPDVQAGFTKLTAYTPTNTTVSIPADLTGITPTIAELKSKTTTVDAAALGAAKAGWVDLWNAAIH